MISGYRYFAPTEQVIQTKKAGIFWYGLMQEAKSQRFPGDETTSAKTLFTPALCGKK